jgi:multiple sugar transport system ATP-binding protein
MAAIEFRGVTKRYPDGTVAVDRLDLAIADGEFMILVGPSGCGKTTALRMVAGLEDISDGELVIDGEPINDVAGKARDIAMVFQNYALYPHMTVRQNMAFALKNARVPKAEIDRRVREAAATLSLTEQLDRKPASLSGGQRQRVAMGRAIVREPKAFLMDEPLSNLDAKLRVQTRAEIARLQQRLRTTTIYVTHDQTEAMTLGDRVAVMNRGVMQQVDSPDTLYAQPANLFVAGFIGSPAMNLLTARIEPDGLRLPVGVVPIGGELQRRLAQATSDRVIVGIRPEQFEDAATAGTQERFRLRATPDVVESMGSDIYAHFPIDHGLVKPPDLAGSTGDGDDPQANAIEDGDLRAIARLTPSSHPTVGAEIELAVDPATLYLFDASSGHRLGAVSPLGSQGATAAKLASLSV